MAFINVVNGRLTEAMQRAISANASLFELIHKHTNSTQSSRIHRFMVLLIRQQARMPQWAGNYSCDEEITFTIEFFKYKLIV